MTPVLSLAVAAIVTGPLTVAPPDPDLIAAAIDLM
jgi:hypothetical protein